MKDIKNLLKLLLANCVTRLSYYIVSKLHHLGPYSMIEILDLLLVGVQDVICMAKDGDCVHCRSASPSPLVPQWH
jgi:hypothetical protein